MKHIYDKCQEVHINSQEIYESHIQDAIMSVSEKPSHNSAYRVDVFRC